MKRLWKIFLCLFIMVVVAGCGVTTPEQKIGDFVNKYSAEVAESSNSFGNMTLEARGKSIVYVFVYNTTYSSEQVEIMKTSLEKSMDGYTSTYNNVLSELRKEVPEAESVIIEYYNGDKTLIYSKTFS